METPSWLDPAQWAGLAARGVDAPGLAGAYLFLLSSLVVAAAVFVCLRARLVVSPNRASRSYGLYTSVLIATVMIATVLENELVGGTAAALPYVLGPQLLLLLIVHSWVYYRSEPWIFCLGFAALSGTLAALVIWLGQTTTPQAVHVVCMILMGLLLSYAAWGSISTRSAFFKAKSIYLESKEEAYNDAKPQTPWLGPHQWVGLVVASILLAVTNQLIAGSALDAIPALGIFQWAGLLLGITATVAAIPAASYWLMRHRWMPELTRFVWIIWIVVGFAFTYGNYLTRLSDSAVALGP